MRDISKWFEEKSSERDSAGIRKHLDGLLARLTRTEPAHPQEESAGKHRRSEMKRRLKRMLLLVITGAVIIQIRRKRSDHA